MFVKDRYTVLDFPEIAEEVGELLRAKDQRSFDHWMFQMGMRIRNHDLFEQLLVDVLNSMPDDVQQFWRAPCPCGQRDLHSHN